MSLRLDSRAAGEPAPVLPLLRWAGSKRGLLGELVARRPPGEWRYIEPFVGSACMFFALQPNEAVLGDRNASLIEAYRTLREQPDAVARRVHAWPTDRETYYAVRSESEGNLCPVKSAARFFYLNRLCFNGVYRTNRKGEFNVPYGRNTGAIPPIERFGQCARLLRRAVLRADDFEAVVASAGDGDFVYLDPPYSRAASDAYGVYGYGSFDGGDFDRLLACLQRLHEAGARVLLSYARHERLRELGAAWHVDEVSVHTHVAGRVSARSIRREALVANYRPCVR
jgi:DNA adenine methylase